MFVSSFIEIPPIRKEIRVVQNRR